MNNEIKLFEGNQIRSIWDNEQEEWYFSVVDIVGALTDSKNPRDYWYRVKKRMTEEEKSQLSTICRQLKLESSDGKMYNTDVADMQGIFRVIQSVPSPKAEPFKMWLAEVGKERLDEIVDPELTIERALELVDEYDQLYATIGWHPTEAGTYTEEIEAYLLDKLKHPKVVALGEIGLDYHWMTASKEVQEQVFRRQIQLSKDLDLPFVVHTRDALEDTYEIIKTEGVGPRGGIMHSFSGTLEWAEKFVALGMTISFSGVVTFKKATDIQEAARELPLDKILVETDAPYLAPVPKRGRENKTAYTRYVVDFIADLRGMTTEELAVATTANAECIFGLDSK